MAIIGMRDLARRTSDVIADVQRTRVPAIVTKRGRPAVAIVPIDTDSYEDFLLAHLPQVDEWIKEAEADFKAGRTVAWNSVKDEFLPQKGSKRGGTSRRTQSKS